LADIKTFAAFGCFGAAAVTSLTSQNTVAVYGAFPQPAEVLRAQLEPILADYSIAAVKVGMLPTSEIIGVVVDVIGRHRLPNVVVDTVLRSTSGYDLMDDDGIEVLVEGLLPLARVVTPNLAEAERLTGLEIKGLDGMKRAARALSGRVLSAARHRSSAVPAVLVKGGHLPDEATDVLFDEGEFHFFRAPRVATPSTHGTGCTLSSAIAALLAQGCDVPAAVKKAKSYLEAALRCAPGLGHGAGPLNHAVSTET